MPRKAIPEEAVREFVQERVEKEMPKLVKKAARKHAEDQLEPKIAKLVAEVLADLDDRGVDTERSNVDVVGITTETVVDAVLNDEMAESEPVEIPVAGRQNKSIATTLETESMDGPTTTTREVEIPVAGRKDGEYATTVEQEVIEPAGDPRLNGDLSPSEVALVYQGALTLDMIQGTDRMNDSSVLSDASDPEEIPVAGRSMEEADE